MRILNPAFVEAGLVLAIPMRDGHASNGSYQDFLTGFVTKDGQVWGRPVGVAVGGDGALYVSDDGSRSIWRVAYVESEESEPGFY